MIKNELYKLWSRRSFLLFLAVLILVNIGINIYNSSRDTISMSAYKELDSKLADMTESEKHDYIAQELEKIQTIKTIDIIKNYESTDSVINKRIAENLMSENKDNYNKYFSLWQNGGYLEYTDNLENEAEFWDVISNRWQETNDYEAYLDSIKVMGNKQSKISIFAGKDKETDTFSSRNIRAIMNKYGRLHGIRTTFYSYAWVQRTVSVSTNDLLIFLFIFLIAGILIYEEKKKQLVGLLRSMPGGRNKCIIAKLTALAISVCAITFIFYLSNILYYFITAGLHGWNAAIQSVPEFKACPYDISTGTYIGINILMKSCTFTIAAILLIFVAVAAASFMWVFISGAAVMASSIVVFYKITSIAKLNWLHYCNLWGFLRTEKITGTYYNLNLNGHPVSVITIFVIISITELIVLTTINIATYTHKRNYIVKKLPISIKLPGLRNKHICGSITCHESYRIFVMYGGMIVFILYASIMMYQAGQASVYLTPNQTVYERQMKELAGGLNTDKSKTLEDWNRQYEIIINELNKINMMVDEGAVSSEDAEQLKLQYENKLAFYPAFQRVYERYQFIQNNPEADFVYEEGYNRLFDLSGKSGYQGFFLLSIVIIIIGIPVFCYDRERGMVALIRTTPGGRGQITSARFKVLITFTAILLAVFEVRQFREAASCYGLGNFTSSVISLAGYENFPEWMSIWLLILLNICIHYIVVLVLTGIVLFISYRLKTVVQGMLTATAILLVPLLLYYLGLKVMKFCIIYSAFSWLQLVFG